MVLEFLSRHEMTKVSNLFRKALKKRDVLEAGNRKPKLTLEEVVSFSNAQERHPPKGKSKKEDNREQIIGEETNTKEKKKKRKESGGRDHQQTEVDQPAANHIADDRQPKKKKAKHTTQEPVDKTQVIEIAGVNKQNDNGRHNVSFRRVDESKYSNLTDNSFWNKPADQFATKAAQDLGKVRGRDFRHEKSKKKKASWTGMGVMPSGINSITFEDSD